MALPSLPRKFRCIISTIVAPRCKSTSTTPTHERVSDLSLHDSRQARRRRNGRGLQSSRHPSRPSGGFEDPLARVGGKCRSTATLYSGSKISFGLESSAPYHHL